MYRRRLSSPFPAYPNLKLLLSENKNINEQCCRFSLMLRQVSAKDTFKNLQNVKCRVEEILKKSKLYGALRDKISAVPRSLKDQSASVLRVWAHQCECVLAQRLRRGQQMFCLYSKLWEERALREFVKQMRHRISARGRDFVIGALGMTVYDWQANRITDSEIKKHSKEIDYVHMLRDKTLCGRCSKNSRICQCDRFNEQKKHLPSYDDWTVFIEKNDLVVWRRLHTSGYYEYKVYGSYNDVSAEDFLNVQIDVDYRRKWDKTVASLNVVESNPDRSMNTDVVYWEMLWPKLFANRDYVFLRRYFVDYKSKTLFLFSKSTKHPNCPKDQTKYRIEDYWSYMVIKPYTDLNKPGIEFSLTYYDNPGVNIPASVTTWVAMKAMPDFLERLREASKMYRSYCEESGLCRICNIIMAQDNKTFPWNYFDDDVTDNTIFEAHYRIKSHKEEEDDEEEDDDKTEPSQRQSKLEEDNDSNNTNSGSSGVNVQSENHSFWRYLQPTYYFS